MSFDFNILLYLGIALISARILGEIFERLKLSSILGELFAGFLFGGPLFLLFIDDPDYHILGIYAHDLQETIEPFAQIGILLLLFIVGAEIKTTELRRAGKRNLFISLTDVTITYGLGFLVSFLVFSSPLATPPAEGISVISASAFIYEHLGFGNNFISPAEGISVISASAFFALIFVPTSIGTTVRTLSNMKRLNTKEGQTLLSLAVFDDFLGLFLLLIVSSILFSGNTFFGLSPLWSILVQILLIGVLLFTILFLLPRVLSFIENRFNVFSLPATSHLSIGIVLAILLIIAFFAEYLGVSAAIGAFLLGIGMQRNKYLMGESLETFTKIGEGSFIPLFFFSVGSSFAISDFNPIYLIIIPLVMLSKTLGSFTGAMFSTNPLRTFMFRMRKRTGKPIEEESQEKIREKKGILNWWYRRKPDVISSSRIAVGMIPKGEITLVIAAIGLNAGAFANDLYSVVILLVLITVFLTPILLRLAFRTPRTKLGEK